jgi:membrane-bound serine protease (ClpP class)
VRRVRRLLISILLLFVALGACSSGADEPTPAGGGIDVIDVSGPLDTSALQFMVDSIELAADEGQVLAVLQINSPAALDPVVLGDLQALLGDSPLPTAVWLGPAPAVAYGGVADLVADAPQRAAAPGSMIGKSQPAIAGSGPRAEPDEAVAVEDTDIALQPSIRQYLQELDGIEMTTARGLVVVETLEPIDDDGVSGVTLKTVTFRKPALGTRFFRLAATPEAAFFFLVVGLTLVTFEFYALGPGVAAGVAALSLWLASWGVANLPVRPWALLLAISGWALLTMAYQRGGVLGLTLLGSLALFVSGLFYVDGSGQIDPRWWLVMLSVLAALFFFLLAMPTVQRSRLSTQTIGRESLLGRLGTALTDFDPEGTVDVGGARWRATGHREAGIMAGASVVVAGVDGLFLEVEPSNSPADRAGEIS